MTDTLLSQIDCDECSGSGRTPSETLEMLKQSILDEVELKRKLGLVQYDVQAYTKELRRHVD